MSVPLTISYLQRISAAYVIEGQGDKRYLTVFLWFSQYDMRGGLGEATIWILFYLSSPKVFGSSLSY